MPFADIGGVAWRLQERTELDSTVRGNDVKPNIAANEATKLHFE
jgi:hypothetical protein